MTATLPVTEDRFSLFRRYGLILWKRKWVIGLVALASVVATYFYTKKQPLLYRSAAKVIIRANTPQILPDVQQVSPLVSGDYWMSREYYSTQYDIIRSRKITALVATRLGLDKNAEFLGLDPASLPPEEANNLAADRISGMLTIEPIPESLIVMIWAEDISAERAATIANAVTKAYVDQNLAAALQTAGDAETDLGGQVDSLESSLNKSESNLLAFRKENVLVAPRAEDGSTISDQRLMALKNELSEIQKRRRILNAERTQLKRIEKSGDLLSVAASDVLQSPLISQLKQDYIESQRDLLDLKTRYLEKHPQVLAQEEKVKWLKDNLDREIKNIIDSTEIAFNAVIAQEEEINQELRQAETQALEMAEKEMRYHQLSRKVQDDERLFGQVLQRYRELSFVKSLTGNNVALMEEARVPPGPYKPDLRYNLLLGLAAGIMGGLFLALALEFVDTTLKSEEESEQSFGAPFLGIVPALRTEESEKDGVADLYVQRFPQSPLAESCRAIRTNLLFASHSKGLHTLLVTSASPREGKTTTAMNLSVTMALAGSRTLLVDTDMRRPRIHKAFGFDNDRGITTAMLGEAEIEDVVQKTSIENLFVLPCGPIPPNPSELLGSEAFRKTLEALRARFDRVIFDSPPVVAVTDAIVLSTLVDGVVIVGNAGKTTRDLARQTGLRLRSVNAPVLGVVMNAVDMDARQYSYSYYYHRYENYSNTPTAETGKQKPKKGKKAA